MCAINSNNKVVWTFLQLIAAVSEESQTSLMTAIAEMIVYTDGALEMVCTYSTFHVAYCN